MSQWTHTLTIIVPEPLMAQANQLALAQLNIVRKENALY